MRIPNALLAVVLAACFTKPDRVGPIDGPITGPDAGPDARIGCVAGPCTAQGGTCQAGTCVIVQTTDEAVGCPDGMPCRIECVVTDACKKGVACNDATSCEVLCIGDSACKDKGVACGTTESCTVSCIGMNACQHGLTTVSVTCGDSVCAVTCDGSGACEDGIDVAAGGTCAAHCCNGGCPAPVVDPLCSRDNVCN